MRDIGHPDAHGRVDVKIFDAREGLSFFENGKRRFFELKDVGSNETVRTGGENPLTICVGHGKEDSRELRLQVSGPEGGGCRFPALGYGQNAEDSGRTRVKSDESR